MLYDCALRFAHSEVAGMHTQPSAAAMSAGAGVKTGAGAHVRSRRLRSLGTNLAMLMSIHY